MHNLEDIKLVPNLATRAFGGTVVYLTVYHGILGGILRDLFFLPYASKMRDL